MQNLNAPGWSAPESKIYFARDATYTLSPVNDAMFGFRHAFAVERGTMGARSKPFGCSASKRKVWGTWVSGADEFITECDCLGFDLIAPEPAKRHWVLAEPISNPPSILVPIGFYADYSIHRKGMIWLEAEDDEFSADWVCFLASNSTARFETTKRNGQVLSFELQIVRAGTKVTVAYPDGADSRRVKLCDDSGELEHRRARDLVDMLNAEESFMVVFTKGISYRSGQLWRNMGLAQAFSSARTDISWRGIDIRRERLIDGRKDTIGDAILTYLESEHWPELVICDDGSNEVADYLVVGDGRYVLIHAKYSEETSPGLRVDDVQVVVAQCLKNLQFFQWTAVEPYIARLASRVHRNSNNREVGDVIRVTLENQRNRRECWVVQPGISSARLAAAQGVLS
jgi:hypothetical protein